MKPIIGISPTPSDAEFSHGKFRRYTLSDTYTNAVRAAGGIPVILPLQSDNIDELLDMVDGVLFSGGGDIDPKRWGDGPIPEADEHDEDRDEFELNAIPQAVDRDIPMLGICRGIQTITVALGGSLYQDIPSQMPGKGQHRQHKDGKLRTEQSHSVDIAQGDNLLRVIEQKDELVVNSFHHQAIKQPAERTTVIANAPDGVIEAIQIPEMTFGLAVQWHPEMLADRHDDQQAIFNAFIEAAKTYKETRKSEPSLAHSAS